MTNKPNGNTLKVCEASYGFYVSRDGGPAEYTRHLMVKHYRSREAAEKALRRLSRER